MGARQRKTKHTKPSSTHNTQSSGQPGLYKLYLTLFGVFAFSCVCTSVIWYVFIREKLPMEYVQVESVNVLVLSSPDQNFVEDVIAKGKPAIIRNSLVTKWSALMKWSPRYLLQKQPVIVGVYENDNKWFGPYYDYSKPMSPLTKRMNDYKTNVTYSTRDFVDTLQSTESSLSMLTGTTTSRKYMYYTGGVEQLGDWVIDDITPYAQLLSPNPAHSSINVWIGQPGVTAHCHYDGYHNFYAQLYGRKKFTLFHPKSYQGLRPYPFLHPSHAQAQVNLSDHKDVELFPSVKTLQAHVAMLSPGDLLYIPPLWYHHVEAVDVSMSVNVWTDTAQSNVVEKVFKISLPMDEIEWNGVHLKAIGSSVILYRLVESVCKRMKCEVPVNGGSSKPSHWYLMRKLWDSCYRTLMETNVLKNKFVSNNSYRKSLACENDFLPDLFYQGVAQKIDGSSAVKYFRKVTDLIVKLPADTWEVWFGNYVEYIAYSSVPLEYVGIFLKHYDSCIKFFN